MSIAKNSFWFAGGTILSRVSGMLRDIVLSWAFGRAPILDWFLVAARIPNLFRDMLAEGALGGAFTKVYSATHQDDAARADQLLRDMLHLALVGSIIFCGLGILLAPWLVELMTLAGRQHGNDPHMLTSITFLTRLLFPFLALAILGAIVTGALHQHNRFFLTAIAPIALNLGYIAGAAGLGYALGQWLPESFDTEYADRRITGLAIGVVLGGLGNLLVQIYGLRKLGIKRLFLPPWNKLWTSDTRRVVLLMLPATVAASTGPINLFISTNFAISAGPGAVSALYYAFHILHLPVGVFGVAIGSAALPPLARAVAKHGRSIRGDVARQLQSAMELVLWFMVPSFALLITSSTSIIQLLYQHGGFSAQDTTATAAALQAYSFSLFGYGLTKVLTSFYYASERTSFAMKIGFVSIALNFLGCYFLVERFGHVGLAMTSSITICANALLLLAGLRAQRPEFDRAALFRMLATLSVGLGVSVALCLGLGFFAIDMSAISHLPPKLAASGVLSANALIIGGVFFMLAVWRFEVTPQQLVNKLRKRR